MLCRHGAIVGLDLGRGPTAPMMEEIRAAVKEKAGIALYEILKRNYGKNEEREDVVNKVVQCIKRLVYGFPAA